MYPKPVFIDIDFWNDATAWRRVKVEALDASTAVHRRWKERRKDVPASA